jgi:ParB family transcriptional regulator, chromosome partitioning protein
MQSTMDQRSGELMTIALSLLVPSPRNVRKTGGTDVGDLKASIKAQGVLQNLIVCPAERRSGKASGKYEVVGGRRRLQALNELAAEGDISPDEEILCRVKPTRDAAEASLAENIAREPMHPADEFEAFKTLVEEGKSVEDVAARFGTSALTVRRRLKLASLHPVLLAQYRESRIQLEQMMALALTDDHAEQLRIWEQAPEWQRDAVSLRRMIVTHEIDAQCDPVAKLVGLDAYEAAGGAVRRDLFAEHGSGFIQDADLLHRLASEKLQAAAEAVRAEGWSWVDVAVRMSGSDLLNFGRCRRERREMTKAEARKHAALAKTAEELDARLTENFGADDESVDDETLSALEADAGAAREALEEFESALEAYGPDAFANAGAVVCVGRSGSIEVHRGLIRPQDRRAAARACKGDSQGSEAQACAEQPSTTRVQHSAALMLDLTAHRTLAARAAMLGQPRVAMAALLHCLVQRVLCDGYAVPSTAVKLVTNMADAGLGSQASEGLRSSKAAQAIADAHTRWRERVPDDHAKLLPWLIAQSDNDLQELLAFCVAMTLNDVRDTDKKAPLDEVAQALSLDMADWWQPTAEGYFRRVTKELILAAIAESAGPEAVARIKGVSKQELARVAERDLQGRGWLPGPLRSVAANDSAPA